MHRDYFGSPGQRNIRAKYEQSVRDMRADHARTEANQLVSRIERAMSSQPSSVSLAPNKSVSSFTPYNQQFLPSTPDSIRRMHNSDDRANYEYEHYDSEPSAPAAPSTADLAISGMIATKMAGVTDVSWWGIFKTWIILRFLFPLFKLFFFVLFIAIVGGAGLLIWTAIYGMPESSKTSQVYKNWTSFPTAAEANLTRPGDQPVRVVPSAEIYKQQQQEREQRLTPVKPTPSYGTNSVFNQQAARPAPVQPAPAQPAYEQRAAAPPSRNLNFEYYCNNPKGVRMEHVQWCERLLRQQYYRGDYGYSGYYSGRRGY